MILMRCEKCYEDLEDFSNTAKCMLFVSLIPYHNDLCLPGNCQYRYMCQYLKPLAVSLGLSKLLTSTCQKEPQSRRKSWQGHAMA